ncbi:Serine incorporator 3 [Tritrichomonas musculus]|uniref:Serine incorporator 3 n=1 Tax=Tritrichomonas musculus TaxID=1915356 RepID=A0ABR2IKY6_9EUKA
MDKYSQLDSPTSDSILPLRRANIFYSIQLLIFGIICLIFFYVPNSWLIKITRIEGSSKTAIAFSFTTRISFSLCLWYIAHGLITLGNNDLHDSCQLKAHSLFLSIHEIFLICIIFGCLFLPEKFVSTFFKISIFISAIYLIFQFFVLHDMFDKLNLKFYTEEKIVLPIIILILFSSLSISLFIVSFICFKCTESRLIIGLNLLLCVIIVIVSFFLEDQSVITASMISSYIAYITFTASMVDYDCCSFSHKAISITFEIISVAFILNFLLWNSFNLTGQVNLLTCTDRDESSFSLTYFHFVLAFASCFVTMIVTNWGDPNGSHFYNQGVQVWIKWTLVTISWIILTLYVWSFFARKCCPDREFD